MAAVVLRVVLMAAVLTGIHIAVSVYMRWDRKKTLEAEHANGADDNLTREDYVAKGLAEYERSTAKKALLGIFILPLVVVVVIAFFAT